MSAVFELRPAHQNRTVAHLKLPAETIIDTAGLYAISLQFSRNHKRFQPQSAFIPRRPSQIVLRT